jgi:hypothetical protein
MRAWLAITVVMLSAFCSARAQQASTPEPVLRVTLDPPRVVVGQRTTLQIEVLAPNYLTAPPELPGFQIRNAVTRPLQSVNISEQQDGVAYAGVRFEFAIYPQEPGSYAVTDQTVRIRYAAEPPAMREIEIPLPRISFEAFIPDAAAGLQPFLAASGLMIDQAVQRSSNRLKTGDAVTRTVIMKADDVPALLLPPQKFVAIDGLALYPAQPSLEEKTVGRTDAMTSTRVDSATYMLERPGDYLLPAIDVRWWNLASGKIETAHLDAVTLNVAAGPGAQATAPRIWSWTGVMDFVLDHWLLAALAAIGLAGAAWVTPHIARIIAAHYSRRRQEYLQSEAWSFHQWRRIVRGGDAKAVYFALLRWLQRFEPLAPEYSLEALKAAAQDVALDREIAAIERQLFAPDRRMGSWSRTQLLRRVGAARRMLRKRAARARDGTSAAAMAQPQRWCRAGSSASSTGTMRKEA